MAVPSSDLPHPPAPRPALKDLLGDGFHLLALLRGGAEPRDPDLFAERVDQYLAGFQRQAEDLGHPATAVLDAKYAFCALADEVVLTSGPAIRAAWEGAPLQLRHFGEHLAGEGFFLRLESLRRDPREHREVLAVYHACLLHGFQGKYRLEGSDRLQYLTLRLGQEIIQARGKGPGFAPHWRPEVPAVPERRFRWQAPRPRTLWAALAVAGLSWFLAYTLILRLQARELAAPPAGLAGPAGRC